MHLVKERSRSAYTLALVMVVLAMIMSVASLSASMRTAMNEILDRQFAADVAVDSTSTFSTEHELAFAALDGIARTSTLRFRNAPVVRPGEPDRQSFLLTIDPASYFDVSSYAWREGDDVSAKAALSAGGAVIMTAPIAESLGIGVGDDVTLRTNEGPRPFEVAALTAGFGTGQPIVIGLADGQRYFNVGRPHTLLADIDPGADLDTVVERLERDFVPLGDFRVNPSSAIKADARSQLDGFFALFYGLLAVAGVVGLLGLANTMAVSVVQRYREVGVLRAIGTQRGQVRRMVTAETATLVLVALVLALPLGFAMSVALVQGSSNTLGYTVAFRFPVLLPVVLALLGLVATMVAAFVPGRRAARMPVVGALQFE
jgi:putative ABC transport system permease protein